MLGALCRCPVFLSRSGSGCLGERGACCTVGFIVQPGLGSLSVKTPECWAFCSGCSRTILTCVAQACLGNHQPCVSSPLREDTGMLGILQWMQSHSTDMCCASLSQQPSAMCLQSSHAADTTLLSPKWPVQPCLNSCPAPDTVLLLVLWVNQQNHCFLWSQQVPDIVSLALGLSSTTTNFLQSALVWNNVLLAVSGPAQASCCEWTSTTTVLLCSWHALGCALLDPSQTGPAQQAPDVLGCGRPADHWQDHVNYYWVVEVSRLVAGSTESY